MTTLFYPFIPSLVRTIVPINAADVYLLAKYEETSFVPGYIGRSDQCLRHRLANHNLLGYFDYFTFKLIVDIRQAFVEEAGGWHLLRNDGFLLNSIHPSAPKLSNTACPYCDTPHQFQAFLEQFNMRGWKL